MKHPDKDTAHQKQTFAIYKLTIASCILIVEAYLHMEREREREID